MILNILLGFFVSYISSTLGFFPGLILVPLLLLSNIPYDVAIGVSLMTMFFAALVGSTITYHVDRPPRLPCWTIAISGSIAAILGDWYLAPFMPILLLEIVFTLVLFVSFDALRLVKRKQIAGLQNNQTIQHQHYFFCYIACGIIAGLIASLLGIGARYLVMPILVLVAGQSIMGSAKLTEFAYIFIALSAMSFEIMHNTLPYALGLNISIGVIIGTFFGQITAKHIGEAIVVKMNYIVVSGLGILMIYRILSQLL